MDKSPPAPDMSQLASGKLNDMVVNTRGSLCRQFGFDLHAAKPKQAELIICDLAGEASGADEDSVLPNEPIFSDNKTLIAGNIRSTNYHDIDADHGLSNRDYGASRRFCTRRRCSTRHSSASPSSNKCIRQIEGGEVTHQIDWVVEHSLVLDDYRNSYILTSSSLTQKSVRALNPVDSICRSLQKGGTP